MALKLGLKGFSWCIDKYGDTILEKVPGNYYTPKKQKHKGSVAGNQEQQRIDQDQDPQEEQQQDPQPPQQQQQQQQQLLQQSPTQRPQYKRAVFSSYHTGRRRSFSDFDPGHQDHDHFDDRLSDLEAGTMSYDQPQRDVYGRRYTPADYTPAADRDYGDAQQRGGYDRDGYAQQTRPHPQQLSRPRPTSASYDDYRPPSRDYQDPPRPQHRRHREEGGNGGNRRRPSPSNSDSDGDEQRGPKGMWGDHLGKEKKDMAAAVIGVIAGGFLGHEAGHGNKLSTVGGAVLGGLAANAWEHQHLKHEEKRRREKEEEESDDDGGGGRRGQRHHGGGGGGRQQGMIKGAIEDY